MKTRRIGSLVKAVLAATLATCGAGGARTACAWSESRSLWDTIRAADTVALVRVVNTPVVPPQVDPSQPLILGSFPPMAVQRIEGVETWKGRRFESLERRISLWESDLGCTAGQTVVAFLGQQDGSLAPTSCLYGDLEAKPQELPSLRKQIRRALSIQERENAGFAERIDWLADQAENPETCAAALYELRPEGDRRSYYYEPFLRKPLAPYLTTSQLDRIERAFVKRRPADVSLPSFLLVLEDRTSRSIDDAALAAIESALAAVEVPEDWLMDSMGLVLERFGDTDGRARAHLTPEGGGTDSPGLARLWEEARRELGIPDPPRAGHAAGESEGTAPPQDGR